MDTDRDWLLSLIASDTLPNASETELLQYEMAMMNIELASLRTRAEEVEKLLVQCQAAAAPIRRVPLEILGEVFAFALPKFMDWEGRVMLVNYALVCKTWRHASLLKNELWSQVCIGWDTSFPLRYAAVSSWYNRSGHFPKALELDDFGRESGRCPGERCLFSDPAVLQLLLEGPEIHRLSLLTIGLECLQHLLERIDRQPPGTSSPCQWRQIAQLDIIFDVSPSWSRHTESPQTLLARLPPVSSLRLFLPDSERFAMEAGTVDPAGPLDMPTAFLEGLSSLSWSSEWSGSAWLQTLQGCANLTHLTFDSGASLSLSPEEGLMATLPSLRALRLQNASTSVPILNFLVTPVLHSLDMGFGVKYREVSEDEDEYDSQSDREEVIMKLPPGFSSRIIRFIEKQSKCRRTVRVLRFSRCDDANNQISRIVIRLHALKELTLDMVTEHPDLWTSLSNRAQEGPAKFPAGLRLIQLLSCTRPSRQYDQPLFQFLQVLQEVRPFRKRRRLVVVSFRPLKDRILNASHGPNIMSEEKWIGNLRLSSGDAATRKALTRFAISIAFLPDREPAGTWVEEVFGGEDASSDSDESESSW